MAVLGVALVVVTAAIPGPMTPTSSVTNTCASPPTFPANPIWCFSVVAEPTTAVVGANSWEDELDTGINFGRLSGPYRSFDVAGSAFRKQSFQHANHWMIDLVDQSPYSLSGGMMVSPNRSFAFENGKLVVEVDAAAGQDGAGGADVFYEIDITPASATTYGVDNLYGYGMFGGVGSIGCRLERHDDGGHTVCSMYDSSGRDAGGTDMSGQGRPRGASGRTWETQGVGSPRTASTVVGGYPGYAIPGTNLFGRDVFRICDAAANGPATMPDQFCRDRFRFEFTRTSLTIFVNGYRWFDVQGLYASNPFSGADNRIPATWMSGVHVYFTSWVNTGQHSVNRWHWDRIAINSGDAPGPAPSYCYGAAFNTCAMGHVMPTPTPTTPASTTVPPTASPAPSSTAPTPTITASPAATPSPVAAAAASAAAATTLTFNDRPASSCCPPLNGVYPAAVLDWGTGRWVVSPAWGLFTTKSISYSGPGITSATVGVIGSRLLTRFDAYNGSGTTATVMVHCGSQTFSASLAAGQLASLNTNFTAACATLTFMSSVGWDVNFDNLVLR